jgi:hypothetical protein
MTDPNTITIIIPNIFPYLTAHWQDILTILTSLSVAASAFVKLTPTLKDDNAILPIVKFISKWIALNRTVDDKAVRNTPASIIDNNGAK